MIDLSEQLDKLPAYLSNHLMVSVIALAIGLLISLPLSICIVRKPKWRGPVLALVSVIQTIPSLALLALMVPLLAGIAALTSRVGVEFSALGFYPTIIALSLYSMLPMVRNTVTGITGIDPAMLEAARGVGMTERQVLWRVELPLAASVIIAGIRTSTVWVIGIATLATPVGQTCLGNYIFSGLQTRNWTSVIFGCVVAALLAVGLDGLIGGLERAVRLRKRGLIWSFGAVLMIVFLGGLVAPGLVRWAQSDGIEDSEVIWIGSKTFTEQYILAEVIRAELEAAGFRVKVKEGLGSTVVFDAMVKDEIDVYVDYSGTVWANQMKREKMPEAEVVMTEATEWLYAEHDATLLGSLGFENAYGMTVTAEAAAQHNLKTIGDLTELSRSMKVGGDMEFFSRPEWYSIRDTYALDFNEQVTFDSTFMYSALLEGTVDVIPAYTSDGRIAAFDLQVLDDPKSAIPPYDAILVAGPEASRNAPLMAKLNKLVGSISVEVMRQANYMVDREDNKSSVVEAANWLRDQLSVKIND